MIYCTCCISSWLLLVLNDVYSESYHVNTRASECDANLLHFMAEAPVLSYPVQDLPRPASLWHDKCQLVSTGTQSPAP